MQAVSRQIEWRERQRLGQRAGCWLLCAGVLLSAGACASSGRLQAVRGAEPNSSWVAIKGARVAQVASGVQVEMPDAPYRARYTDAQGTYYKASVPLLYRTSLGTVCAMDGGLYLRYDSQGEARIWTEPVLLTPTMPYPTYFEVERHLP